ncbi:unnamed protein product [Adineta ricciae]|uniref:Methyltransferase type 11 domain-containing protein n=1 Tax=Adineta ricciae TaxID=249248 RepID=A0A815LCC9_ADIRI|nr:unnamed protein product [Adineta ricciae]CAF1456637.1 unnamed protein product [Adineta ricciae]
MISTKKNQPSEDVSNVADSSTSSDTSLPTTLDLYRIFNDTGDISSNSRSIYNYLAETFPWEDWTLMNYGFLNKNTDMKKINVTNINHNTASYYSILLYAAVVDDIVLQNLDVLEVGCGRGGGCAWISRTLMPHSILGVDYSESGIELCQKIHSHIPNLRFEQGNAEHLSCLNDSFDVVINVESSHCYPSMERFLSEVYRVLKPGGYFLWADFRDSGQENVVLEQFKTSGLEIIEQVDITENVVLALHKTREDRLNFLKQLPKEHQEKFEEWLDNPSLKNNYAFYWRYKCKKALVPLLCCA